MNRETLAFRHCLEGYAVANLRACMTLWTNEGRDARAIACLVESVTRGSLRNPHGLTLIRQLREYLGDLGAEQLLELWIAAIHDDVEYRQMRYDDVVRAVLAGTIPIERYLPQERLLVA
jgi:hypothetical protein